MCDSRWNFRKRRYHSSFHSMTIELSLMPKALVGPSSSLPKIKYDLWGEGNKKKKKEKYFWSPVNIKFIMITYFFTFNLGHLQSRSLVKTYSEIFCLFDIAFTTLSSVLRKTVFTWSVNLTDSDLLSSSLDFVADGTASFAMTRTIIAKWWIRR